MLKKIGMLSFVCLPFFGGYCANAQIYDSLQAGTNSAMGYNQMPVMYQQPYQQQYQSVEQPRMKMPTSIVVCRSKQCAPTKLSMSKEYVYNTLLHMFDSNARKKALVCAADANTHSCTEEYISIPVTVGVTPAYMYINDVKITDVSISDKNTAAMNLTLNWGVSYNGQTPTCRPSKTLLYAKDVNNVIMEDNGYSCKMTTIGTTSIKTLFAIDYIDLDYGFIGGFYSVGLSGPAYGGGSGYMLMRLPEDISMNPRDFVVSNEVKSNTYSQPTQSHESEQTAGIDASNSISKVPNVDTVIRYNHAAQQYDKAQSYKAQEVKGLQETTGDRYKGVEVFPLPISKAENTTADD